MMAGSQHRFIIDNITIAICALICGNDAFSCWWQSIQSLIHKKQVAIDGKTLKGYLGAGWPQIEKTEGVDNSIDNVWMDKEFPKTMMLFFI